MRDRVGSGNRTGGQGSQKAERKKQSDENLK